MDTEAIYEAFEAGRDKSRHDLLAAREQPAQHALTNAAMYRTLTRIGFKPGMKVLDAGAGAGSSLFPFVAIGCEADSITCIEDMARNVEAGRRRFPGVAFHHGSAAEMSFADASFDLVLLAHVAHQVIDPGKRVAIGRELRRVVRPGGWIVVRDWSARMWWQHDRVAIPKREAARIVGLPVAFTVRGALNSWGARKVARLHPLFPLMKALPFGERVYAFHAKPTAVM